jgi:hypothetical protein
LTLSRSVNLECQILKMTRYSPDVAETHNTRQLLCRVGHGPVVDNLDNDVRLLRGQAGDLPDDLSVSIPNAPQSHDRPDLRHCAGILLANNADDLSLSATFH